MIVVGAVVLLAPLLRHVISDSDEESTGEKAFNWIDSARQILSGLWPR
jgi:hypothetical protein